VPQGSSLGPLFFLIYVNDITNALNCKSILFADDTCLVVKASNPQDLQNKINKELENLTDWCSANKLTINPSKSNVLIIPPKLKRKSELQLNVNISGTPVNIVKNVTYLGVIIDDELIFKSHLNLLEIKVARTVDKLSNVRNLFPQTTLKLLYNVLVHPMLHYGEIICEAT